MTRPRTWTPFCAATAAAAATLLAPVAPASAQPPAPGGNVLMLLADDVGVDNIAVYAESATAPPTPNVDALAANGVLFRNAWATPHCSPTRASLLTGRYPSRHGVGIALCEGGSERCPVLPLPEVTLPEVLDAQATGYAHALLGKWHLSDERNGAELGPNLAGWSHYAGILGAHPTSYFLWPRTVNGVTTNSPVYATTQVVDDALSWIQTAPEPWVCYVWFPTAHAPYHAPPAHLHSQNLAGLDPATTPVPFYKAMVEAMDTEIGRLLGSLGPALLGRTDVLFLGDNGTPQEVSEPPFLPSHAKKTPFEGGVNVPLIVAGPNAGAPGREEAALVHAVDVFATVLELCGARPEVPFVAIDGVSFASLLAAPGQQPARAFAFTEQFQYSPINQRGRNDAVRDDRYKLIRYYAPPAPPTELLFDLALDPFEQNNLLEGPLTPTQHAAYTALLVERARIVDTSGSFSTFGATSCAGSNGAPAIGGAGTPRIGSAYTVSLSGAAASQPALLLTGASRQHWGSLILPWPLAAIGGGAGCLVYGSGELLTPTATTAAGTASLAIPVPNLLVLISASIYHTWLIADPSAPANALGITASDGGVAVVGT